MKDGQHGSKNRTLNNGHHDCFTAICTYIHNLPAHLLSLIFVLQYSIEKRIQESFRDVEALVSNVATVAIKV